MGISISEQAVFFVLSAGLGIFLGVCYDFLGALRHAVSKKWATAALDVLFGLLFLFAMFCFGMSYSESRVRGYMFLGAALGAGEYFLVFSPLLRRALAFISAAAAAAADFALTPVKLWITFLKNFSKNAKFLFKFLSKWYRMKITFIRPPKNG